MDPKYEAIIDLPRPVSENRARLSARQRAAQFAPFAALTGFDGVLAEVARQTEEEIFLEEDEKAAIDRQLRQIRENLAQCPLVEVTVYRPDGRKAGGSYRIIRGKVLKIDEYQQKMRLESGEIIEFHNIIKLLIL